MTKLMKSIASRVVLVAALATTGCDASAPSGAAAVSAVASAALVIDVREPSEFAAGHLEAAENIPVGQVEGRVDEIASKLNGDKSKHIVVYCKSGGRSARAKDALEKAGFQNVTNAGGYDQLKGAR
jgi:phage shock protein E